MSSNYEKSLEAIKSKHGGVLPSDLFLQTNAQLGQILFDLTGDIKYKMAARVSKETLVARIQKLTAVAVPVVPSSATIGEKRKASDANQPAVPKPAKTPRNCVATLSQTQIVQMKRVMAMNHDQIMSLQHEKDLRPLWTSIGMVFISFAHSF